MILIEIHLCSGCAGCVDLCPEVFRLSDLTGKAELLDQDQEVTACVLEAARFCPEQCIAVADHRP